LFFFIVVVLVVVRAVRLSEVLRVEPHRATHHYLAAPRTSSASSRASSRTTPARDWLLDVLNVVDVVE
jgi:hypothetical protein